MKLFGWDGKELNEKWKVDFYKLKLGRPHHMKFGAKAGQLAAYPPATVSVANR